MRRVIDFNQGFEFEKDGKKHPVTIPHTWNADNYDRGTYIYTKHFPMPEKAQEDRAYLEFCGVNSSARVILNGRELAVHDGGYSTFRVEVTDVLKQENELRVLADNAVNDRVYPQKADFTFYGGIYRDVNMIVVPPEHFALDYSGGTGFKITPVVDGDTARVRFEAYYTGEAEKILVSVSGKTVQKEGAGEKESGTDGDRGRSMELALACDNGNGRAEGTLTIPDVHLWNGIRDPYLYRATAVLYRDGEKKDEVSASFGCRTFRFDAEEGFFLNGERYPLRGVSRHQDREGVGNALTREMHEEDMELILSMGANSIRLAHYQHDQYFYDLCDEKGLVVWAEIPYITVHMPGGRENTVAQMKELIVQNYNHASIVCWAISNEISLEGVTDDLLENHRILNELIHQMDPGRVSAMANLFMLETDSPLVELPDICGYNLYYGWYVGEMKDNDAFFDQFHREHPDTAIGLTEYGADSVIRLQSPKPVKGDYTESYQALYHEHMLQMISERPYLWGTYVWNMFEFGAADRDEAGDPGKNHKGLISFDRKQKKDAYYIYKAWWSEIPFVHLCGRRYHDRIEDVTEVKVYSNQNRIALYVDGTLFAGQEGEHVFRFEVPISGTHTIRAVAITDSSPEGKLSGDRCCADISCTDGELADEMEIVKVSEPNPDYFADAAKVRNWFDEPEETDCENDGFLSLNSTMAEIQAAPEGAALLERMMSQMQDTVAGGMGKNVKIPKTMQEMIARQPLKRLLAQAGIEAGSEQERALSAALAQIPKRPGDVHGCK